MFRIYESVNQSASNTMVVAYYDKAAAADAGKHLQYFLQLPKYHEDSNFENVHPDFVSVSLYGEVITWIQRSKSNLSKRKRVEQVVDIGTVIWMNCDEGVFMGHVTAYNEDDDRCCNTHPFSPQ